MKKKLCFLLVFVFLFSMYSLCVSAEEYTSNNLLKTTDSSISGDTPQVGGDINLDDIPDDIEEGEQNGYYLGIMELTPNSVIYCVEKEEINASMVKDAYIVVNKTKFTGSIIDENSDLYNNIDNGVFAEAKFDAKVGDKVYVFLVTEDGTTVIGVETIKKGNDELAIDGNECDIEHTLFYYLSDTDPVKNVNVTVDGKEVSCKEYSGSKVNDYEIESFACGSAYIAEYSAEKGQEICVTVTTEKGFIYTCSAKLKNAKPTISLNSFYAGDTVLKGKTNAFNAKVSITIGKKKYSTKSDNKGIFKKSVKAAKTGTKISITVTASDGVASTKTFAIKKPKGTIKSISKITYSSRNITFKLTKARKGDKVVFKLCRIKYTFKVKKIKKSYSIKIYAPKKGTKVTAVYTDKFGTKKCTKKKKVK